MNGERAYVEGDGGALASRYRAECSEFVEECVAPILHSTVKDAVGAFEEEFSVEFDFDEPYLKECVDAFKRRCVNSLVGSQKRALKTVKAGRNFAPRLSAQPFSQTAYGGHLDESLSATISTVGSTLLNALKNKPPTYPRTRSTVKSLPSTKSVSTVLDGL